MTSPPNLSAMTEVSRRYSPFYESSTPELLMEHKITKLFEKLCYVFYRCRESNEGLDECNYLLALSEEIDLEYQASMPESFNGSDAHLRTTGVNSMLIYNGEYYVFPDKNSANKYLHSRCIEFILLETVLWTLRTKYERFGCNFDIPDGTSFTLSGIKARLRCLSHDVTRAIPYRFGHVDPQSGDIQPLTTQLPWASTGSSLSGLCSSLDVRPQVN